ncbi:sensor histidine kinase [uncultured Hymenobacter sp.]|uniref:sensor histidine kinase n=1 Tax=uncultured Hymenobacter sp. TaxID=170016 RepID=UPI0035C9E5BA
MPTPAVLTAPDLEAVTVFAGLPTAAHAWLLAQGEGHHYEAGETISEPGSPAEFLMAVIKGGMQFYGLRNGQREPVFRVEQGGVSGVLPYSRLRIIKGQSVAVGDVTLYRLHRDRFPALEQASPELVQRLVAVMSDRAREEVRNQERDDKLRALGKLSAGLAHELNNPAAAIARAAQTLAVRTAARPRLLLDLLKAAPDPAALTALTTLVVPAPDKGGRVSALDNADREDELADWLESQGSPDGYRLAAGLLAAGLGPAQLAPVLESLPPTARPAALAWLESQLVSAQLIDDLLEAGQRISKLVQDVKTYSHMDRDAGLDLLGVAPGLDSTLNMLGHVLRQKNVRLTRDYAADLPQIRGQVSSLNQVWTNLIDNALDALPAQGGELTLRTAVEDDFVRVFIIDNGPGIPADVLPHIFEPFYTTKPPGEGSGMGLEIAQRIIRQHGGRLEVRLEPGRTEFCAWLPVAA